MLLDDNIAAVHNDCRWLLLSMPRLIVMLILVLFRVVLVASNFEVRFGTTDGRTI